MYAVAYDTKERMGMLKNMKKRRTNQQDRGNPKTEHKTETKRKGMIE